MAVDRPKDTLQPTSHQVSPHGSPLHLPYYQAFLVLKPSLSPRRFELPFPFSPSSRQYQPVFSTLARLVIALLYFASLTDRIHTHYTAVPIT
jgi:hypothetical protein